jgi:hypothetical protein
VGDTTDHSVDDGPRRSYSRGNVDQVERGVTRVQCECQHGDENGDPVEGFVSQLPARFQDSSERLNFGEGINFSLRFCY